MDIAIRHLELHLPAVGAILAGCTGEVGKGGQIAPGALALIHIFPLDVAVAAAQLHIGGKAALGDGVEGDGFPGGLSQAPRNLGAAGIVRRQAAIIQRPAHIAIAVRLLQGDVLPQGIINLLGLILLDIADGVGARNQLRFAVKIQPDTQARIVGEEVF